MSTFNTFFLVFFALIFNGYFAFNQSQLKPFTRNDLWEKKKATATVCSRFCLILIFIVNDMFNPGIQDAIRVKCTHHVHTGLLWFFAADYIIRAFQCLSPVYKMHIVTWSHWPFIGVRPFLDNLTLQWLLNLSAHTQYNSLFIEFGVQNMLLCVQRACYMPYNLTSNFSLLLFFIAFIK